MALKCTLHKKVFHFSFEARTSRGIIKDRTSWFFKIFDEKEPDMFGVGECAPLVGLSPELNENFEGELSDFVDLFNASGVAHCVTLGEINELMQGKFAKYLSMSSVVFAMETAMLDLANGGKRLIFPGSFVNGAPIPINGLIWMGGMDFMLQQIEIKIRDGFRCIKLKVGGLDFEKECDVLQYVRRKYFRDDITIRLDANGAFKAEDALYKLNELAKFKVHSIEQPLKKGSEFLAELCAKTPIPIALDEELLGISEDQARVDLLRRTKPQFIILKPALHGGMYGAQRWLEALKTVGGGWWITSALESNVGLNAIAQFVSQYPIEIHQGLGTGMLYDDNFESPLEVLKSGNLGYHQRRQWEVILD
jgi:o-succinylbenzoate synthase